MDQVDAKTAVKKLKQQNDKLKTELSTIKKSLHAAVSTQKNAEIQSKRPNFSGDNEDEALKALHKKIQKLKKERDSLKAQSSTSADEGNTDLENEIKYLKSQLKDAENEQKVLKKVIKEQEKGIGDLNVGQLNSDKKNQLKEEIKKARDDYKELHNKIKTEEQQWKQDHEKMVMLKEKIREKKPKVVEEQKSPQEEEITDLNKKIDVLKKSIAVEEAKAKRSINDLQAAVVVLKNEEETLKKKIKEKDQDSQIKTLKIKELKQSAVNLQKKVNDLAKEDKKKEEENELEKDPTENFKRSTESHEKIFSKPPL
jgi:chromosome segregation ATPase